MRCIDEYALKNQGFASQLWTLNVPINVHVLYILSIPNIHLDCALINDSTYTKLFTFYFLYFKNGKHAQGPEAVAEVSQARCQPYLRHCQPGQELWLPYSPQEHNTVWEHYYLDVIFSIVEVYPQSCWSNFEHNFYFLHN